MKKLIAITTLSTVLLTLAPAASAVVPNLVANGSFEEPIVDAPQDWDIYVTSEVPGWYIEWRSGLATEYQGHQRPGDALLELHHGVNGWLPSEGDQYAELDTDWDGPGGSINDEPASVRIYQDVKTDENCLYSVSFDFSPRPGEPTADNMLKFEWGGSVIDDSISADGSGNSNTVWTTYTYDDLPGAGAVTRIAFTDEGDANSLGTFLDNVIVTETSCEEPSQQVDEGNCAFVVNKQEVFTNTGDNGIGNSKAFGGNSESTKNDDNLISTGIANSFAESFNIVNSNLSRGCCEGSQLNELNHASVFNFQKTGANTGGNDIGNSIAFGGMQFRQLTIGDGDGELEGGNSTASNNDGNRIYTGGALSSASIFNIVNSNIKRELVLPER